MDDFYAYLEDLIAEGGQTLCDELADLLDEPDWAHRLLAGLALAEHCQDVRALPVLAEGIYHGDAATQKAANAAIWEVADSHPALV
ncbi:MAG: hypothetical protein GYB68_14020, partial [Chloroflexi bacterium]|nr:hypothetical protein [Chloroflexota bacterium]